MRCRGGKMAACGPAEHGWKLEGECGVGTCSLNFLGRSPVEQKMWLKWYQEIISEEARQREKWKLGLKLYAVYNKPCRAWQQTIQGGALDKLATMLEHESKMVMMVNGTRNPTLDQPHSLVASVELGRHLQTMKRLNNDCREYLIKQLKLKWGPPTERYCPEKRVLKVGDIKPAWKPEAPPRPEVPVLPASRRA